MTDLQSEEVDRFDHLVDGVDPKGVESTGDDSPAQSVWRYIWRISISGG